MNFRSLRKCLASCTGIGTVILTANCQAQEYSTPQIRLPLAPKAPVIDGKINAEEWQNAGRMEGFGRGKSLAPMQAGFWVSGDNNNLYIAVRSETPPGGKLMSRANPAPGVTDARPFMDDSVEIVVDPFRALGTDKTGKRRLYHFITNAKGAIYDQAYNLSGGGEAWRGDWRIANNVTATYWDCEIAIPWSSFGATADDLTQPIGLRIGRNWKQTKLASQTEWSPLGGAYLTPETLPVVAFDASAPVVQALALRDDANTKVTPKISIRNPGTTPLKLLFQLNAVPQNSAPTRSNQPLTLAAEETKIITVPVAGLAGEGVYNNITVTSPDEKIVYYQRSFSLSVERPGNLWVLDANANKKIDTSFAYYPSHHAMKVKINLSGLEEKTKVSKINLAVRPKTGQPVATMSVSPLSNNIAQVDEWKLPVLATGEYELVVALEGLNVEPQVLPFARHQLEWEGNDLGKSDIVVPPFTPITVDAQTVGTVLRQHRMNGLGLLDQITALEQPLLKSPMHLEVISNGKLLPVQKNALKFSVSKPTQVVTQAGWSTEALQGTAVSEWDYDGVMKYTLTLQPTNTTIDSLTLKIPLDGQQMPLMHACTDGLRFNYAGKVPAGQGVVWDSSKAARNSIIGTYVPYIWLGSQERGLAVFGENDGGWITDDKLPAQQIVRNADGNLELRLNLISTPSKITEARTITLGFQATPIKPMPENWRLWTVGARGKVNPAGSYHQAFLGSAWYWGSLTAYNDLYPRDKDYTIYDKFVEARKTGKVDQQFIDEWLTRYKKPDLTTEKRRSDHINYAFRNMANQPKAVLSYTNARGVRFDTPDGQTYLDEWNRETFSKRQWPYGGSVSYDMDPVESFRDYAMFYYKKMFNTYLDSIYWDDVFLQSNFDTIGTAAYQRSDGNIQPSSGIWNMRALLRRAMILGHEEGKTNTNMVHMTNTALSPVLGLSRTQADWEDRAGDNDFQDRFSRELIQTESIGRQFGNVPIVLTLVRGSDNAKKAWARRTGAGVMLSHELKPWYGGEDWKDFWDNTDRLRQFGYGSPQAKVWNYWQKDYPAQISGETSSLIVSKPGSAMLVVCDYGEGGNFKVKLDRKALGLNGTLIAKDVESDTILTVSAADEISFDLKKHDFKMISVRGS